MKRFLLAIMVLAGCADPVGIKAEQVHTKELGQGAIVSRTVPLSWHASEHWDVDPLFGAAVRSAPCGAPEPDLRSLAIEVDAASVPSGSTVLGVTLVIDPCDERGAWLPDNLPAFALFSVDRFGNATQTASAMQDQSPDAWAYSAPHEIVAPTFPAPVVVNREKSRYMVLFEPEHGLEATGGTRVTGLIVDLVLP